MRRIFGALLVVSAVLPALAQNAEVYLDDRSTAVSLLRSYYNAINRHEYARAWSYWDGHAPNPDYQDFVDGFADTVQVTLFTGEEMSEGAAGSTFHSVAMAIEALDGNGTRQTYAGCVTLRLAQPAIQEPPFHGLHIERAGLRPVDGPAEVNVPETCMEMQELDTE